VFWLPILKQKDSLSFINETNQILVILQCLVANVLFWIMKKYNLGKFDSKVDEGIFLDYSSYSHAYKVYNKRTMTMEESMHIEFDKTNLELRDISKNSTNEEDSSELLQINSYLIQKFNQLNLSNKEQIDDSAGQQAPTHEGVLPAPKNNVDLPKEWRIPRDLSLDNIIGPIE